MTWCLGVAFILIGISVPPATAQSGHEQLEKVINRLRKLYQDSHSTIEKIKILRQNEETDRAQELAGELEGKLSPRLEELRGVVEGIQTDDRSLRRKVSQVRTLMGYFERYLGKFLSNWEPENPQLLEAFNRKELIARGIASPEMLRKQYLTDLTSLLHSKAYVREDVVAQELNRNAAAVQSEYQDVLETFLGLLKRLEDARDNEEKDMEEVARKAEEDWKAFWSDFQERQTELQNGINRFLVLYRGRERLPSEQQQHYNRGLRVKRQFNDILEFRKSVTVDNLFTNPEAIHDLLVMMGRRYSKRLMSLLTEHTQSHMTLVQSFNQGRTRLEEIETQEQYQQEVERIDSWVEDAVIGKLNIETALEQIQGVPVRQMTGLIGRLRSYYGDKEKELGEYLAQLRQYTLDFFEFAERAEAVPEEYVQRFKEVSFESKEQFQRVFPGPLEEKLNQLEQDQQKFEQRLSSLKDQSDDVLSIDFQLGMKGEGRD